MRRLMPRTSIPSRLSSAPALASPSITLLIREFVVCRSSRHKPIRIGTDPRSGKTRTFWSLLVRDHRDNALARLGEGTRGINFGADWRLNHIAIWVDIDVGTSKPARVTVKHKPPGAPTFKRSRFEGRIIALLRRNGLAHDREPSKAAIAAE